jgi:hypothetical protein
MSDAVVPAGDIFVVPATGGEPRNLTAGMKASASWLAWLPSSHRLLFTSYIDGTSGIATVKPEGSQIASLWTGPETIEAEDEAFTWSPSLSLSRDGLAAATIRHSFQQPPEVWAGTIGDWKPITHANANLHPQWAEPRACTGPATE